MANSERATSEVVREFIERDGVVRNGLARGLINARALARHIQVATHEQHSFEALVSAIHRYPVKESAAKYQNVGKLISKLTMRNEIVAVGIVNAPEIAPALARFSSQVESARGETLHIVSGVDSVTVVIDSKNLEKLMTLISKRQVARVFDDVSEIIVSFSDAVVETPGVYAALCTELAINGVNIFLTLSYGPPPYMVFVVNEKNAVRGYQALERLSKSDW